MTRFWWVRHGPTHARTMTGWTDLPADLSDTARLARLAALLPPDAPMISSDLSRAVATADAIRGARPRLPHDPRLREIHFGAWEGLTAAEVSARDPALSRAFWEGAPVAAPQGEGWPDLVARIAAAMADLPRVPDVVVVAHFGAILSALHVAGAGGIAQLFAQPIDNLSLTEVARGPEGWSIGRINHAA
ncbi:MAG: histidine phosphatase family protein [Gemmobacter sp.]